MSTSLPLCLPACLLASLPVSLPACLSVSLLAKLDTWFPNLILDTWFPNFLFAAYVAHWRGHEPNPEPYGAHMNLHKTYYCHYDITGKRLDVAKLLIYMSFIILYYFISVISGHIWYVKGYIQDQYKVNIIINKKGIENKCSDASGSEQAKWVPKERVKWHRPYLTASSNVRR